MQLTFSFSCWHIEASEGILGRQYDNLAHQIVVVGSLPEGYTWDMLVECRGNYNIIPLTVNDTGASATLTADQLALSGYYDFQLRGTQNSVIHHTNSTQIFIPDTIVGPGTWPVLPTEFSEAEAAIKELNAHPPTPGENGYWMIWDLDTHAYVQSDLPIPGLTMQIGDTITGEPGTTASVENVGTPTAPKLQFTIPRGDEGKAATVEVGEVTASDPGSEPQVTNAGTENAAVLDFVLPRGQTGPTGQAATVEVESTITGQPGTQASVENVGTTGSAKLRFTIPQGAQGVQGNPGVDAPNPQITVKETSTLPAGSPATVEVEGESPNFELSFGIPQGPQGAQGIQGKQGIQGEQGIQGPVGPTGATPNITMQVTALEYDQEPTVSKSGTPEEPVFTLGIPQGQPGQDGVQINDKAVNTTETWSSKKLLDTLCPPFTETGNPITCNPVEGYPLDVTVTMEPIQEGEGDPSPKNVRPISGYDEVTVNTRGKNLCQFGTVTFTGIYQNENAMLMGVYPPGSYQFSADAVSPEATYGLVQIALWNYTENAKAAEFLQLPANSGRVSGAFTATKPFDALLLYASNSYPGSQGKTATFSDIQLELGSTSTAYEPYQPGTTDTLTFPETIYGGTVDAVTGVGSSDWTSVTFNGSENWQLYNSSETTNRIMTDVSIPVIEACTQATMSNALMLNLTGQNVDGYITYYLQKPNDTTTRVIIWADGHSLDELKQVMSTAASQGTPLQIVYKVANPTSFQATGNQPIPALAGENTVYTDGDSLTVNGRTDPLTTIQTMQAQITALQDQATQGGTA